MICTRQLFFLLVTAGMAINASASPIAISPRPTEWATPVVAQTGLPNLFRVNENLYRSAQPSREGFVFLDTKTSLSNPDLPVKTVISLRSSNDDSELLPKNSALRLENIRFNTWHAEDEDVIRFLRIASSPSMQPVLLHCKHGADRTGTMIAIYRIAIEGWSKQQAIDEMINGGYGFHPLWQNLVRYINALDVDAIKNEVAQQGYWPNRASN